MESPLRISSAQAAGLLYTPAPDQTAALSRLATAQKGWVVGSSWKKNLEVLVTMCWKSALNGETSLICVSPNQREEMVQILKDVGMHGLFFDLKGHADSAILGAFQVARKKKAYAQTTRQAEVALQEFIRWTTDQMQGLTNLEQVLFGELRWKDIVDQRCVVPSSAYQHFLTASVRERFDLTHKEYWHLRGRIKSFARLRTLRTAGFEILDALNPKLFEDPDANMRDTVTEHLKKIVAEGRDVLCVVADAIHAYKYDLTSDHQARANEMFARVMAVQQMIAAGETKYGQKFFDESTLSNTWHTLIRNARPEIQMLHQSRDEVRTLFMSVYEILQESEEADLIDITAFMPDPLTMEAIKSSCDEILDVLNDWTRRVDAHASENHKRINAQNIGRSEDLRQLLRIAESRIDAFIELLTAADILKTIPEVNALSLEKKAAVIEATVRLCLRLLDAASEIDAYTLWTGFWSAQNNRTRSVLRCLDLMEDEDLVQAFDTWYFGLTLGQVPDHTVMHAGVTVESGHPQIGDLRAALDGHLRAMAQTSRHEVLREVTTVYKSFIQSIAKSQMNVFNEELRVLPAKDMARLFPVLLCSPEHVNEFGYYFDTLYVVSDEGHDYKMYATQAKRCMMFSQMMPKSAPEGWEVAMLTIDELPPATDWREVPTSERLGYAEKLVTQFSPFLDQLRVYNSRGVQVFSFLGDRIDGMLMQRLGMPYKQIGELGMTNQLLVECFLDRRKPIMLLLRDWKIGQDFVGYLPWHVQTIQALQACGLRMANLWSVELKNRPSETLDQLYETIRDFAEQANAATHALQETAILERNARSGSHATQQRPEDKGSL